MDSLSFFEKQNHFAKISLSTFFRENDVGYGLGIQREHNLKKMNLFNYYTTMWTKLRLYSIQNDEQEIDNYNLELVISLREIDYEEACHLFM